MVKNPTPEQYRPKTGAIQGNLLGKKQVSRAISNQQTAKLLMQDILWISRPCCDEHATSE